MWSECKEMVSVLRPGRGQTSTAAPLNVMAGWWETELQGAPGWLELRRDVIAGCTRLIDDWPCCWVARDDGHEARSCTAATVSCSPLLLCLSWLVLHYFSLLYFVSLPCFLSESFDPVSLLLFFCVSSLSVFFLCLFVSLSLSLCGWLASPGLLLSAGAAALLSVRECRWVSFEEGRNPEFLGSLPLSINQAWPPHIFIHVLSTHSRDALPQQEVKKSTGRACWKTREERLCFCSHHPSDVLKPNTQWKCVRHSVKCHFSQMETLAIA